MPLPLIPINRRFITARAENIHREKQFFLTKGAEFTQGYLHAYGTIYTLWAKCGKWAVRPAYYGALAALQEFEKRAEQRKG